MDMEELGSQMLDPPVSFLQDLVVEAKFENFKVLPSGGFRCL